MKKTELIRLKKLLDVEINRRKRINELLTNDLVQEFLLLNNLSIDELELDDKWRILSKLLKEFQITESNGIFVCTGNYTVVSSICYEDTDYYTKLVPFDNPHIQYQSFKDIETNKTYIAYTDAYILDSIDKEKRYYSGKKTILSPSEFCHSRYKRYLVSELIDKYTILNPYNSCQNENGFENVQKDFFMTSIEKGQPKAKQLLLTKYSKMK